MNIQTIIKKLEAIDEFHKKDNPIQRELSEYHTFAGCIGAVRIIMDGYVLVPKEPTQEMIAAGCAAYLDGSAEAIYKAMLNSHID